jgi:putative membrane protein
MWWDGHMGGWTWFWMTIMMVAFWAVVALLIVVIARLLRSANSTGTPTSNPLEILAERFARGEIDEEDRRRMARVLGESDHRHSN